MLLLVCARILIAILPFRRIAQIAGRIRPALVLRKTTRNALTSRIGWAIQACARRAPFRAVCFQQGLATHVMLRRRGIPSVLYYGVAENGDRRLAAHVWVCDRGRVVIGGEDVSHFAVLAEFPLSNVGGSDSTYRGLRGW
jgi:hypothetical protein